MTTIQTPDMGLDEAAQRLQTSKLVSFPTETVYGLGANALDSLAVAKIFETKGRPQFNPLIVHVSDLDAAKNIGKFDQNALFLVQKFWPGPLTLVVPRQENSGISDLVTAGLDTIAIRMPDHPVAQKLLKQSGLPLAAPSANVSGHVSPTTAQHVATDFHDKDVLVLDGGATGVGIESTVVSCFEDQVHILRPGSVTKEDLEGALGFSLDYDCDENEKPSSPGQLLNHYAPKATVRLNAMDVEESEALMAFGRDIPKGASKVVNLSSSGDLREAAANLFAALRELDASGSERIAVMPIPNEGLGVAINDRLKRAAAPRK